MIGYKMPLGKAMMGHKMPLGKAMIGHMMPLLAMKSNIKSAEVGTKKMPAGLERNVLKR